MSIRSYPLLLGIALLVCVSTGCKSASNAFWEKMGYEKRELLVSDVKKARDEQNKAKEEIKSTMDRFKEVTNFQGGELEAKYNKLKSAYDDANSRAGKVSGRIDNVEKTAGDLFEDWEKELGEYTDAQLRSQSREKLDETKGKYKQLIGVMRQAEGRMKPVLAAFNNHVLYLKHNLNAAAISSLQGTTAGIDQEVSKLITEMESSIKEANDFISSIEKS